MDLEKMSVGEVAGYVPGVTQLFRKHNIEFCCQGHRPLSQLLQEKPELKEELGRLAEAGKNTPTIANEDFRTIVAYIVATFHDKHRADFPELLRLSERVEIRHAENPNCPTGLHAQLVALFNELTLHMQKEEGILFPILANNPFARPVMPIQAMMAEHDECGEMLATIYDLTHQLVAPEDACTTWRALYVNLDRFIFELKEHISLENNVLFKRALQAEGE